MDYFELAQGSSLRMCCELEKRFPNFRGKQLELMMYLCLVAYNSEIYDGVCQDAWLRTTITLSHDPHVFSCAESPELVCLEMENVAELCQAGWEWLLRHQSLLTSRIKIRSNILPRRAYWERLQELQHSSYWTRVLLILDYWRIAPCCINRRGFFPITVINQALEGDAPLTEKVTKWRQTRGRSCDLATHFQRCDVPHACQRKALRMIKRDDVDFSMNNDILGVGSTGTVYKVAWRNGTYAMKSYRHSDSAKKERDIASKVLHPHIVHGFGYGEVDGESWLLMEVLGTTLSDHATEKARVRDTSRVVTAEPLFSPADTFDVLLQIASALEHCHLRDVIHGDLKPENILLDHFEMLGNGRHFLAKVTDFGDAQNIIPTCTFRPAGGGTNKYAAPELLKWRTHPDEVEFADPKKLDVYGFGAVAHEVLTGYSVYNGRHYSPKVFKEGVISGDLNPCESEVWRNSGLKKRFPAELIELVEKCWEFLPENRPSFEEIRAVLVECKSTVQSRQGNRAADRWKVIAAALLLAFICCISSLVKERRIADPIEFIALILFAFLSTSLLMKLCVTLMKIWGRICLLPVKRFVSLQKFKTA